MDVERNPEKRRETELANWSELTRRVERAKSSSEGSESQLAGHSLQPFSLPPGDPHGVVEMLDAMRASAISRWQYLTSNFSHRHYFQVEVLDFDTEEGRAEMAKIEIQERRVAEWLEANLREGQDFEIEGTGVSCDYHIFFRTPELYQRFCAETGEPVQAQER